MPTWPEWWDWELELSSHLLKRMEDRDFNELEVRQMLSIASGLRQDIVPDRWVIETRHRRKPWEVIVEPDRDAQLLIVITAYSAEP
jgi:Domain of unknown function (DUF4258)